MTTHSLTEQASGIMSAPVTTVRPTASLAEAAGLMIERNVGCLPVVDQAGSLVGMLTERMLQAQLAGAKPASGISFQKRTVLEIYVGHPGQLENIADGMNDFRSRTVREVMDEHAPMIDAGAPLWEVADAMMKHHVGHVAVVRGRKVVGVIARHDLIRAIAGQAAAA